MSYTCEKVNQITSQLLEEDGRLKKEFLALMADITSKSVDEIEASLYGSLREKLQIKEIANVIVSSAVIAVTSEFSEALKAAQLNTLSSDLNRISEYDYLVTNITKKGELVDSKIETFKPITRNLTFDKLFEYTNTYKAIEKYKDYLDEKIRLWGDSEDIQKHLKKLISLFITVKGLLVEKKKLPHDCLEKEIKVITASLMDDVHQLENELKKIENILSKADSESKDTGKLQLFKSFVSDITGEAVNKKKMLEDAKTRKSAILHELKTLEAFIRDVSGMQIKQNVIIDALNEKIQLLDTLHHRLDKDNSYKTDIVSLVNLLQKTKLAVFDDFRFANSVTEFDKAFNKTFGDLFINNPTLNKNHLTSLKKISQQLYVECDKSKNSQLDVIQKQFSRQLETLFNALLLEAKDKMQMQMKKN